MSIKKYYSSVAMATLAVFLLTACKPAAQKSQTETSTTGRVTRSSEPSSASQEKSSEQKKTSPSTATSSSKKTTDADATTDPAKSNAATAASSSAKATDGKSTIQKEAVSAVSPGAVAGQWQSFRNGRVTQLNADGKFVDSTLMVAGLEEGADGQLTLRVLDTVSGAGFALYYYPAGVKIPLQLVETIDGKSVYKDVEDPTDSSKERIVTGNANHLAVTQEHYDSYLDNVSYRP